MHRSQSHRVAGGYDSSDMTADTDSGSGTGTARSVRHIVVLATPTAQSLEVAAPAEVFSTAVAKLQEAGREWSPSYRVTIAACSEALEIRSSTSGLRIMA